MATYKLVTSSESATILLGHTLFKYIPLGSVVLLTGDLGAGKTTLVKGIAEAFGVKEKVISPTFNIMKLYPVDDKYLIHIDAYRLEGANLDIGLDEYIGYEKGITIVEWPNYIASLLPKETITIDIHRLSDNEREITINNMKEGIIL